MSFLLGAINLNNSRSYTEPIEYEEGYGCVAGCPSTPLRKTTVTNHSRTALSVANMGIGAISILRSGYHLIKGTAGENRSTTSLRVTQLETAPLQSGELVPGVQLNVRF